MFEWLPLLAGILVVVAAARALLGGDRFESASRAVGPRRPLDPVRKRWRSAVCSHASAARKFADYECDPAAVLRHPDLADVTRPATALFIDAFAEANALSTDEYPASITLSGSSMQRSARSGPGGTRSTRPSATGTPGSHRAGPGQSARGGRPDPYRASTPARQALISQEDDQAG
ncbi:MAG TPA: hypothetical protein VE196_04020 [Pseudonocardiaceae bacterium]|nr:hypothetical protein [Pseudonocardiaceae bacterium]